ncbi:DUF3427 domain-containing protein [Ruania zhangjianzhongii]|uniref:DUF3427 domain-containing protein n=1 Tax=Ruania zhangjianzhongii TaxID=2603206 RepID=UPI0011C90FE1|nr:DEAD/DEAH box helicase [Ruania zhangjianzhongii]
MGADFSWARQFELDVDFGYVSHDTPNPPRKHNPLIVLNEDGTTVLRTLRDELAHCQSFTFSVAFVSSAAIALLKQDLLDFRGRGRIITSDYLGFNTPEAFEELHALTNLGVDVRLHRAAGFHPKGYIFQHANSVTAMMGSSNLTPSALLRNHEWNLKVTAAVGSDLGAQLARLVEGQLIDSVSLSEEWIAAYAQTYTAPPRRLPRIPTDVSALDPVSGGEPAGDRTPPFPPTAIQPNQMQRDALDALSRVRASGETRAVIISATGTGKTILSALDVRAVNPRRLLFVVHREQVLDRSIQEYRYVLGGSDESYGKLSGSAKDLTARYLFATIQTLSQPHFLSQLPADLFDYVIIDEAHRAGASSHRRVLGHFEPVFLLGMTATPERTDGFNVFKLFDYNVPYEIRLNHALEEGMLAPFHYYGIADATFTDSTTVEATSNLPKLISPDRVDHLIWALETYGQAGVAPKGLIFCSRKDEARALSEALDQSSLRGRPLRTTALTGDDSVEQREGAVKRLEGGELDYILTVDVFNEGVDIPSVNQVVMLRQTESSIVFVQQLGRGLRKSVGKEYLVVIDFIGNYTNNYLIPIALFGDDSLNKESLRQNLIAAEESGAISGLSSVHFDKIAQERILRSITATRLDDMSRLKAAIVAMRNRVGTVPRLWDFFRFESVDPVLLATKREHYPALIERALKEDTELSHSESRALQLLSAEVFPAKRAHELTLLKELLADTRVPASRIVDAFESAGLPATGLHVDSAVSSFTLEGYAEVDLIRYRGGVAECDADGSVSLHPEVATAYRANPRFREEVDDLVETGLALIAKNYDSRQKFTAGRQYSRKEVLRNLGLPRKWASTLYGYKVDRETRTCPIFVTLHKAHDVSVSTAYADALLDETTMLWYTRSRRTMQSAEVRTIVSNDVDLHVFVKKDDAEGTDFYYLGQATSHEAEQTKMGDLDVVRMRLRFAQRIEPGLYDYFHPTFTATPAPG